MVDYPKLWPSFWRADFAANKFFYVSGVREALAGYGVVPKSKQRSVLKGLLDAMPKYPENWLATFPGSAGQALDSMGDNFGLESLGPAIIDDLTDHKTLTFPKAALCLLVLLNFAKKSDQGMGQVTKLVRIRLANCYVPSLEAALEYLSPAERKNLIMPLGGTETTLQELSEGFPVTSFYAKTLVAELKASLSAQENNQLQHHIVLDRYAAAEDVRANVRKDGRSARNTLRAARYEKDIFYIR